MWSYGAIALANPIPSHWQSCMFPLFFILFRWQKKIIRNKTTSGEVFIKHSIIVHDVMWNEQEIEQWHHQAKLTTVVNTANRLVRMCRKSSDWCLFKHLFRCFKTTKTHWHIIKRSYVSFSCCLSIFICVSILLFFQSYILELSIGNIWHA